MNLLLLLLLQEDARPIEVPNAMGAHTWFIILAAGSFLGWAISYSLQLQREARARKKGREEIVRERIKRLGADTEPPLRVHVPHSAAEAAPSIVCRAASNTAA